MWRRASAACAAATAANAMSHRRAAHPPLLTASTRWRRARRVGHRHRRRRRRRAALARLLVDARGVRGTLGRCCGARRSTASRRWRRVHRRRRALALPRRCFDRDAGALGASVRPTGLPELLPLLLPGYGEKAPGKHPATLSGHYGGWADSPACSGTNQDMWSGGFGGGGKDGDWATVPRRRACSPKKVEGGAQREKGCGKWDFDLETSTRRI